MDAHIRSLSEQITRDKRAQKVCSVIRSDGVDYASMDAAHYLKLLQEVEREEPGIVPAFRENVPEEIHPWKRYAARTMDSSCMTAAVSLLLAQDGCGWQELNEFIAIWEQEQDKSNTSFQYKNLEIQWSIDANNCDNMNGMFVSTGENEGTLALTFSITILDNT